MKRHRKRKIHLAQFLVHGPTYHSLAMWRHPLTDHASYRWDRPELYQHIARLCGLGELELGFDGEEKMLVTLESLRLPVCAFHVEGKDPAARNPVSVYIVAKGEKLTTAAKVNLHRIPIPPTVLASIRVRGSLDSRRGIDRHGDIGDTSFRGA